MSEMDVEQELTRLLNETRAATEPAAGARARIRAGLGPRLGHSLPAPAAGFGAAKSSLLLAGGVALVLAAWWLQRSPPVSPSPVIVPSAAAVSPSASLALTPRAAPQEAAGPEPLVVPDPVESVASPAVSAKPRVARPEPETELALIGAMQLALRAGNASQALGLAAKHAQRFPQGALTQEREGVRAIARCQLAKPEARTRIREDFLAKYGSSPYAARVEDACKP